MVSRVRDSATPSATVWRGTVINDECGLLRLCYTGVAGCSCYTYATGVARGVAENAARETSATMFLFELWGTGPHVLVPCDLETGQEGMLEVLWMYPNLNKRFRKEKKPL